MRGEVSSDESDPVARPLRPEPKLSGWALTVALLAACLLPLAGLTIYALTHERAHDDTLPVVVDIGRRPVPVPHQNTAILADVIIITNQAEYEIPRLTIDLNGQYFLHREEPLGPREELVLPLAIFSTKSNQRWVPGRYPLTEVNITGQLPSRRRGVLELEFDPPK